MSVTKFDIKPSDVRGVVTLNLEVDDTKKKLPLITRSLEGNKCTTSIQLNLRELVDLKNAVVKYITIQRHQSNR